MPDLEGQDVAAESSPAITGTTADSSAGTQITEHAPPAEAQVPFHQHPRFRELIDQNRQFKGEIEQLRGEIQRFQQTPPKPGEPPSPEHVQAAEALLKIMEANPRLKVLLGLADAAPQLVQGYQGVQRLSEGHQAGLLRSGRERIDELAGKAGLPVDKDSGDLIEEMVTGVIRRNPEARARFNQGDLSVINEAFDKIQKGFVASLRRDASVALAQAKNRVKTLPPAPTRGGIAGREAPTGPEEGKEREWLAKKHAEARSRLESLTG